MHTAKRYNKLCVKFKPCQVKILQTYLVCLVIARTNQVGYVELTACYTVATPWNYGPCPQAMPSYSGGY